MDKVNEYSEYAEANPREFWWCNSHKRRATHLFQGKHVCSPNLGGILLSCSCVRHEPDTDKILTITLKFTESKEGLRFHCHAEPREITEFHPETRRIVTLIYNSITNVLTEPPAPDATNSDQVHQH